MSVLQFSFSLLLGLWTFNTQYRLVYAAEHKPSFLRKYFSSVTSQKVPKNKTEGITYFLYTKDNPKDGEELKFGCDSCLENSHWDRNASVKILCHGFHSSSEKRMTKRIKNAYLNGSSNYNIIQMNWQKLARGPRYDQAVENVLLVGRHAAALIDYLVAQNWTSAEQIHFIGHSLGAHVAGVAGHSTNPSTGKLGRITGLDPARPRFKRRTAIEKLDSSDALFVDVIHTAGGKMAYSEALGHADFYPNGGTPSQPGCGVDIIHVCSHRRAHKFFEESIKNPLLFKSCKCNNWVEFAEEYCRCEQIGYMGDAASSNATGLFYLRTQKDRPYGLG